MKPVTPATWNKRLTLRRSAETDAGGGVADVTPTEVVRIWASGGVVKAWERARAGGLGEQATHRFTIRLPLPTGVTILPEDTLLVDGIEHDLLGAYPSDDRRFATLETRSRGGLL